MKSWGYMIHSIRFTCVLDTNVIYPIEIRDFLFWLAFQDMYTPKWSMHIFDEWRKIMAEKGVTKKEIDKRIDNANKAFPDALVQNYESLISCIDLPDDKDRHVVAAAIKTNANLIVTHNLKDFPNTTLYQFGLSAKNPDEFITDLIDLDAEKALEAFQNLVLNRRKPEQDEFQVLDIFRNVGLKDTANFIHSLI